MLKAATTYNLAADRFDAEPLSFWSRHGARAVELLGLRGGERVLDVGCGTGASAIPAARTVGAEGFVLGIDVADRMLDCARAKAAAESLRNLDFELRDMTAPADDLGRFEAVISVFSIFFVEDVEAQLARLWKLLRPGGRLIVTVWGRDALEPLASVFAEEVRRLRPDLPAGARPWERLVDPDALRRTFRTAGTETPALLPVEDRQPLVSLDDWWTLAMGCGYRWEIEQLTPPQRATLRERVTARLRAMEVQAIETPAIHALAVKPMLQ